MISAVSHSVFFIYNQTIDFLKIVIEKIKEFSLKIFNCFKETYFFSSPSSQISNSCSSISADSSIYNYESSESDISDDYESSESDISGDKDSTHFSYLQKLDTKKIHSYVLQKMTKTSFVRTITPGYEENKQFTLALDPIQVLIAIYDDLPLKNEIKNPKNKAQEKLHTLFKAFSSKLSNLSEKQSQKKSELLAKILEKNIGQQQITKRAIKNSLQKEDNGVALFNYVVNYSSPRNLLSINQIGN